MNKLLIERCDDEMEAVEKCDDEMEKVKKIGEQVKTRKGKIGSRTRDQLLSEIGNSISTKKMIDLNLKIGPAIDNVIKNDKNDQTFAVSVKSVCAPKGGAGSKYCSKCQEVFPSRRLQRHHLAAVHREELYYCNLCTYSTLSETMLKLHVYKSHTGKVRGIFACNLCGFKENSEDLLKKHTKIRHKVSVKIEQSLVPINNKKVLDLGEGKDYIDKVKTEVVPKRKVGRPRKSKLDIETASNKERTGQWEDGSNKEGGLVDGGNAGFGVSKSSDGSGGKNKNGDSLLKTPHKDKVREGWVIWK